MKKRSHVIKALKDIPSCHYMQTYTAFYKGGIMSTNGHYKINVPKIVHETIDGETVILNLDSGNYYSLIGIGADIWDDLKKGTAVDHILAKAHRDYIGDKEDIEAAINNFLLELMEENLTSPYTSNNGPTSVHEALPQNDKTTFHAPKLNKYTDMQDLLLLDPIHDVDDNEGWPNVDDKQGWPTRNPDLPSNNK